MSTLKKNIAVAEISHIIRKGLVYLLSHHPLIGKVIEWKEIESHPHPSQAEQWDAIIINPMIVGRISKNEIRQKLKLSKKTIIIALVYNMIDEQFYKSYDAVLQINDSESAIESIITKAFKGKSTQTPSADELSERETEILKSLVKGMSNKEIADYHNISIHTVITHRRNISRKLKIHTVPGLTIYAMINKLVDINDIKL